MLKVSLIINIELKECENLLLKAKNVLSKAQQDESIIQSKKLLSNAKTGHLTRKRVVVLSNEKWVIQRKNCCLKRKNVAKTGTCLKKLPT